MRLGVTESRLRARTSTATRHETNVHAKGRVRCGTQARSRRRRRANMKCFIRFCFWGGRPSGGRSEANAHAQSIIHHLRAAHVRARRIGRA